ERASWETVTHQRKEPNSGIGNQAIEEVPHVELFDFVAVLPNEVEGVAVDVGVNGSVAVDVHPPVQVRLSAAEVHPHVPPFGPLIDSVYASSTSAGSIGHRGTASQSRDPRRVRCR